MKIDTQRVCSYCFEVECRRRPLLICVGRWESIFWLLWVVVFGSMSVMGLVVAVVTVLKYFQLIN